MNDYSDNINNIQNKTLYDIEEEYKEMISEYRKKINVKIQDCIEETFRGIPDGKIEDWVEELFLDDFKIVENHNFKKIEQILDEYKYKIPIGLENGRDLSRLINEYQEELKDVLKKHNIYNLEDLISEFSRQISNKISYYLEVFKGISNYNIENKIDELKYSLRRRLESIMSEYYEEYNFQIVNILNKNIKSIQENVNDIEETKQIPKEILEIFEENMIYSGYNLIIENDKIYAENIKTKEKIELKYKENEQCISNKEKNISFYVKNNEYCCSDELADKITVMNDNKFEIANIYGQYHIEINKTSEGYEFRYGDKKIEDLTQIGVIINVIKSKSPKYYEKLLQDEKFKIIIEKTKEHDKKIEEIYYDEKNNQVRINPKTRELFELKLKLFGYEIKEKEDGLYINDINSKKEGKIEFIYNSFRVPALELWLNTNYNYISDYEIKSNLTEFIKGNNKIIINNFKKILIRIDNDLYNIIIEEDNVKYISKNNLTKEEIIEKIKKEFPYFVEYIEQKEKEIKKEERQENIEELKQFKSNLLSMLLHDQNNNDIIQTIPKR